MKSDLVMKLGVNTEWAVYKRLPDNKYKIVYEGTQAQCKEYIRKENLKRRWVDNR